MIFCIISSEVLFLTSTNLAPEDLKSLSLEATSPSLHLSSLVNTEIVRFSCGSTYQNTGSTTTTSIEPYSISQSIYSHPKQTTLQVRESPITRNATCAQTDLVCKENRLVCVNVSDCRYDIEDDYVVWSDILLIQRFYVI